MEEQWECVVVGGGSAGLSAALVLGRARRRTLVIDAGEQSNLPSSGVGGLLGNDRRPPAELYAAGRAEVAAHPSVEIRTGESVAEARVEPEGFALELGDGSPVRTRKLLLATGMEYIAPELPGLRERWGEAVFHCPFCHGWEVRGKRLGVLGSSSITVQKGLMLKAWSEDVTLLTDEGELPGSDDRVLLERAGVALEERPIEGFADGAPAAVRFRDGSELDLDGLMVPVTLRQRSPLAAQLGLAFLSGPMGEETLEVDPAFQTSVNGVYAAGDVCTQAPTVTAAIAAGSTAAGRIVHALMVEAAGHENAN